jgi:hypothetical protein
VLSKGVGEEVARSNVTISATVTNHECIVLLSLGQMCVLEQLITADQTNMAPGKGPNPRVLSAQSL